MKFDLPDTPDTELQDMQFKFTGQWLPDLDPALIGPENYSILRNLRYNDAGLEGVAGYTIVNTTPITTYDELRNGYQFRSERKNVNTTGSYILGQFIRTSNERGRVYVNKTAPGSQGDWSTTGDFTTADTAYDLDVATANRDGRFSAAPQNTCCYCNGEEVFLYSGNEHRIAAAFMSMDREAATYLDISDYVNTSTSDDTFKISANLVPDPTIELGTGWNEVGSTTTHEQSEEQVHSGVKSWKFTVDAEDEGTKSDTFSLAAKTYRYSAWVYPDDTTNVNVYIQQGDGSGSEKDKDHTGLIENQWNYITDTFTVSSGAIGSNAYIAFRSPTGEASGTWYIDDICIVEDGYYSDLILLTTRPVRGFYFDLETLNTVSSTASMTYWDGDGWTSIIETDGTDTGPTLGANGSITFNHTYGDVAFKYLHELYLYAYRLTISAGSAEIASMSCDPAFQKRGDIWDGVYRECLEYQVSQDNGSTFADFSVHVNQLSDTTVPIGGELGDSDTTTEIIALFEEQLSVMQWRMLGDLVNSSVGAMQQQYWNGFEWTTLTFSANDWIDGTAVGGATCAQTGVFSWNPPSDEVKVEMFNSVGYAYRFLPQADFSGTNPEDIVVDLVYGIPALNEKLDPFDFSAIFSNRLMLGSFSRGDEGNRMDYSLTNAPDVWNGSQSSEYGTYSLRFGGVEKLTGATQLFNRFGASVFSMLLVFKASEIFMLVGDTPDEFQIFPVSQTIGCPCPLTLATAEVGLEIGQGMTRNIAIWVSHSGPMMFDGAVLTPLRGIMNYFDPADSNYVDWDNMDKARGWVDNIYKEYNLLLPSGPGVGEINAWLVYDLIRKKWYMKDTGSGNTPLCGFNVISDTGEQMAYGGDDDGQMLYLENGTTWNGTPITHKIRTGDFWPSDNIWDRTLIRKFKFYVTKTKEVGTVLNVTYFADTDANSGAGVTWQDQAAGVSWADTTDGVSWADTLSTTLSLDLDTALGVQRITRVIDDLNRAGWSHAFEFECITEDTQKGFQPIAWGVRYMVERKDDQAT